MEAGTNMSIGCPGLTENTFVVQLEWRCVGQCGDSKKISKPANSNNVEHGLLKYVKDQDTTVFKNKERIRLDTDVFSLGFNPVSHNDQGSYACLINNRANPDAIIKLKVLGKSWKLVLLHEVKPVL